MKSRGIALANIVLWTSCFLVLSCSSNKQIGTLLKSFPSEIHPVLLFTVNEIPTIRSRITREPYASWWKWVKEKADEALTANYSEISLERKKSRYAKSLAFVYVVTEDTTYAEKTIMILESILTRCEGGNWGDIHTEMDAVPNYCQAYDMLAHYLENYPEQHRRIRAKMYAIGHRLYSYSSLKETANNWRIRRCAALGLCALAIMGYGEGEEGSNPKDWYASAIKGIMKTIDYQTTSDGGHAEGLNYLRYSADLYIPYLLALYRATRQNLFQTTLLQSLHDWGVKIRLPNGQRPNFDDAALDWFYGGLFARFTSRPSLHQWDWLESEKDPFCPGDKKIDAICNFDDTIEAKIPDWNPTLFLPEAGNAVFRSDWSSDGIYMLLLGEQNKVRLHGGAHDQPDPMSFIIYAYGEMLAIDGGYIKWKKRHKVNKPKNHNLILVDGEGPSSPKWFFGWHGGTDAYLQNYFAADFIDYGEVKTRYRGVDFVRSVLFLEHRYFIVVDEVRSDQEHQYTWLLHGNGLSSEGSFSLSETEGTWIRNGVSLHAYMTAPANVVLNERQDIHSFHYDKEETHSLISAEVKAKDTRYMSLLYPRKESDTLPVVSSFTHEGIDGMKIERDGYLELILFKRGEGIVSLPNSTPEYGSIRSDARILTIGFLHGILQYTTCIDATLCEYNGQIIYTSDTKLNIAIRQTDECMDGYVKGEDQYHLELFSGHLPKEISFRSIPVDFQYEEGKIVLYLEGEGSIKIQW